MEMKKLFSDMAQKAATAAEGAKDVLADASRTAGEKVDVAKQNLELSRLRSECEAVFADMGRTFYLKQSGKWPADSALTADQQMETLLAKASEKDALISELSARIAQMNGKVQCPACRQFCPAQAAFCPSCGAPLSEERTGTEAGV